MCVFVVVQCCCRCLQVCDVVVVGVYVVGWVHVRVRVCVCACAIVWFVCCVFVGLLVCLFVCLFVC